MGGSNCAIAQVWIHASLGSLYFSYFFSKILSAFPKNYQDTFPMRTQQMRPQTQKTFRCLPIWDQILRNSAGSGRDRSSISINRFHRTIEGTEPSGAVIQANKSIIRSNLKFQETNNINAVMTRTTSVLSTSHHSKATGWWITAWYMWLQRPNITDPVSKYELWLTNEHTQKRLPPITCGVSSPVLPPSL